jgi:D-3-phosphoglycerate dehydrogenase
LAARDGDSVQVQTGKVAITDWTFPDLAIELAILKPIGHEVVARQCKTEADLISLVGDADCVITQFARVNANVIAAMNRARAIIRYGIGVDNVDLDAARTAGIAVCNVPDYCIHEVADQTLAFILGLTRQVVTHTAHVRGGKWGLAVPLTEMRTLKHLTVGVAGFGRIGREVVRRLLPFQCRILIFDPLVPPKTITEVGAVAASFEELLINADVLTLHCPSTAKTRKMISSEALARMKRGALLINVARGDLVDTDALVGALENGQLGGAALDVCDPEPIPAGHRLLTFSNVLLAPHIASASPTAVRQLRETVAHLAAATLSGKLPPNIVNGMTSLRALS